MVSKDDRLGQAHSFRTTDRETAMRAHPELEQAYSAVDALRKVAHESGPASRAVAERVDLAIRTHVAAQIQAGTPLSVSQDQVKAVRVEVAYGNLVNAADQNRFSSSSPAPSLPADQRSLLVEVAQDTVMGRTKTFGLDAAESPVQRATVVARELSGLDYPARHNPFNELKLADVYQRDAVYRQAIERQEKLLPNPSPDR